MTEEGQQGQPEHGNRSVRNPLADGFTPNIRAILTGEAKHCPRCGGDLFHVVPGKTTPEEIEAFAKTATFVNAAQLAKDRWIHPGIYCPHGCTMLMINYGPRARRMFDPGPLVRAAEQEDCDGGE